MQTVPEKVLRLKVTNEQGFEQSYAGFAFAEGESREIELPEGDRRIRQLEDHDGFSVEVLGDNGEEIVAAQEKRQQQIAGRRAGLKTLELQHRESQAKVKGLAAELTGVRREFTEAKAGDKSARWEAALAGEPVSPLASPLTEGLQERTVELEYGLAAAKKWALEAEADYLDARAVLEDISHEEHKRRLSDLEEEIKKLEAEASSLRHSVIGVASPAIRTRRMAGQARARADQLEQAGPSGL